MRRLIIAWLFCLASGFALMAGYLHANDLPAIRGPEFLLAVYQKGSPIFLILLVALNLLMWVGEGLRRPDDKSQHMTMKTHLYASGAWFMAYTGFATIIAFAMAAR